MSEKPQKEAPAAEVLDEIRTRRLAIVSDDGQEIATLQIRHGVIELRVGEGNSDIPCSVVLHSGEPEAGVYTAGCELWAKGNSIGGCQVTCIGEDIELHRFGDNPG